MINVRKRWMQRSRCFNRYRLDHSLINNSNTTVSSDKNGLFFKNTWDVADSVVKMKSHTAANWKQKVLNFFKTLCKTSEIITTGSRGEQRAVVSVFMQWSDKYLYHHCSLSTDLYYFITEKEKKNIAWNTVGGDCEELFILVILRHSVPKEMQPDSLYWIQRQASTAGLDAKLQL